MERYKQGYFFSEEFVGKNSWNGFERNCLFANRGEGSFIDVARATGSDSQLDARAVATADLNGDGWMDLVISNNDAPPTILLNRLPDGAHWVELELVGRRSNRDAVGAEVRLTAGGKTMVRVVEAGSGYAAQSSHVLHFGLADASAIEELRVRWPSGAEERFVGSELLDTVPIDSRSRLVEAGDS